MTGVLRAVTEGGRLWLVTVKADVGGHRLLISDESPFAFSVVIKMCVCWRAIYRCCVLPHSTACTSVLRVLSDWTLGAAAYPSKKLAMSVRRHTKVLADREE